MLETSISAGFEALLVPPYLLQKLERSGIVTPTPIQTQCIPVANAGEDVIGIAQTGTGKTLAFALPIMARLEPGEFALVLAPTRELAEQISKVFQMLEARVALLIGGEGYHKQKQQLRSRPQVIIATPGRTEDHLQQRALFLDRAKIVVLDEVDRMLDMGFSAAVRRILDTTPEDRQTLIFSATLPKDISDLATQYQTNPVRIEIQPQGTASSTVTQELIYVPLEEKREVLGDLLNKNPGTILVFSRTRHGARKIARDMVLQGHKVAEIHADRTQAQRRQALEGFRNGHYRVLVATDIAARGIDVKEIGIVINYDVPDCSEDYIHRIGRTGRAGHEGRAILMATPQQVRDVRDIERILRHEIPLSEDTRFTPERKAPRASRTPVRPARDESRPAEPRTPESRTSAPRSNGGYVPSWTDERRDSRPAPRNDDRGQRGEHRPWQDRPMGRDDRRDSRPWTPRPYPQDRPQNSDRQPWTPREGQQDNRGGNNGYQRDRNDRPYNGDRKPWTPREGQQDNRGGNNGYQRDRNDRPYNGDRKPWTPREGQDNRAGNNGYQRDRNDRPYNGDRKPWTPRKGQDNRAGNNGYQRDRNDRPYNGDRKPWTPREGQQDNRNDRPYNADRKPWTPREGQQDNRNDRPYTADRKPWTPREGASGDAKPHNRPDGKSTKQPWSPKPKHKSGNKNSWPKDSRPAVQKPAGFVPKGKPSGSSTPSRANGSKVARVKRKD